MTTDRTVAKIGRSMKNFESMVPRAYGQRKSGDFRYGHSRCNGSLATSATAIRAVAEVARLPYPQLPLPLLAASRALPLRAGRRRLAPGGVHQRRHRYVVRLNHH